MTNARIRNILGVLICCCLLQSMFSCKKVDHYAAVVAGFPSLDPTYPTIVLVGDTMTVTGRLFMGSGSNHIQVGDTAARVVYYASTSTTDTTLQIAKFIITASMGIGSNIPVALVANGYTVEGPEITIKQFNLSAQTDTTLWVDQIGSWLPANVSYLQSNSIPLFVGCNNSVTGTMCFNNPLGIYILDSLGVQPALLQGATLQEGSVTYSIDQVAGGAISADGTTFYFSAAVLENSPDTAANLIFRLAKMQLGNPASVTTINRTLVPKQGTTNEVMSAFQGPIGGLEVVAGALQTDINGNLYFINFYFPQQAGVPTVGPGSAATNYLSTLYYALQNGQLQSGQVGLSNTCVVSSTGILKSIFSYSGYTGGTVPGYSVDWLYYTVDAAGANIYGVRNDPTYSNFSGVDLFDYDLSINYPLFTIKCVEEDYTFKSFDTSAITGLPSGSFQLPPFSANSAINYILPLPNGTVVTPMGNSLVALIPTSKLAYLYAGTEAGLGNAPAAQVNLTGKAKWVNFSQTWGCGTGGVSGLDRQGAVYYYGSTQDYTNGVVFYKMYSKK